MIEILGVDEGPEFIGACELRDRILRSFPQLESSKDDRVWLIVGAKCHGQARRDIDLLLAAHFQSGLEYNQSLPVMDNQGSPRSGPCLAKSLLIAIEIKDHPPEGVRFNGANASVRYNGDWKGVSEQSHGQQYAVTDYLRSQGLNAPPFCTGLIWFRNVQNTQLPPRPHNFLGTNYTFELVLNVTAQLNRFYSIDPASRRWILETKNDSAMHRVAEIFTKELRPTVLDQRRLATITRNLPVDLKIEDSVGKKLVIIRGEGGTGKTICLLQLARTLSDERRRGFYS